MTLVQLANRYFRENPREINEFNTEKFKLEDFKEFDRLEQTLNERGYTLSHPKISTLTGLITGMGQGHFELQRHNVSVGEHDDDTVSGLHFAFLVVQSRVKSKSNYDMQAVFSASEDFTGKMKVSLEKDQLIVFNPKKKHSLTYFGEEVTLALFDCFKLKG